MKRLLVKKKDPKPKDKRVIPRVLGLVELTCLGVGSIIGAGIFVLTGNAAAQYAGPSIVLAFVLSGIGCAFAGLCYAEMASMIPIAGSAYTYSYYTLGEFLAWIIGWDLILEYALGASAVAVGLSGYLVSLLRDFGITVPPELIAAPGTPLIDIPTGLLGIPEGWQPFTEKLGEFLSAQGRDPGSLPRATALFDLPAVLVIALITGLLIVGIKESVKVNNVLVILKVCILVVFIVAGIAFLFQHPDVGRKNWEVFIPPNRGKFGEYGWSGILRGAGVIFFAYIGFDAVSTAAQEAKDPQRNLPIAILGSLVICTVLYIVTAGVLTAVVHYSLLLVPDPMAVGVDVTGMKWLALLIKVGAIGGISSVILVSIYGQSRIFWVMAEDGLLPAWFAQIHPRFQTPYITTLVTGIAVAVVAGLVPIHILGELVSIGTLLAFVLVCLGVLRLRRTHPEMERPFRTPWVPLTPALGALVCLAQMVGLPGDTWIRLIIWMVVGLLIYFLYGFWHSELAQTMAKSVRKNDGHP
jgi:APA family basic amino acid/polyamine antiporter